MIPKHVAFVFERFLKSLKTGQNRPKWYAVSPYFFLNFCHFFNFLKTGQKSLKTRQERLKMIPKDVVSVLEPFSKG